MQPLDPKAVAGIDQRAGECNVMLDALIAKYRKVATNHGTAAAVGVMGGELYALQIRSIGNVIDVLAFAIARLAENETEPPTIGEQP